MDQAMHRLHDMSEAPEMKQFKTEVSINCRGRIVALVLGSGNRKGGRTAAKGLPSR